ncbi:MAG: SAM-dependent methyltransferase [Specibacter sp.]
MTSENSGMARDRVIATGLWIAAARAAESARPDKLFDDSWADALAGETGRAMLAAAPENPFLPVRTRYFDDCILAACRPDSQLVLLGAGMDTRAFRLALPGSCNVFELDHSESLAAKDAILGTAQPGCPRSCVAADLAQPWQGPLLAAGFDPSRHTVWIAEGLLFYLSSVAVEGLIADTAALSAPGSLFLADTFGTGLLDTPAMAPLVDVRRTNRRELPFCTDEPEELFRTGRWAAADIVEPGQPRANYGRFPHGTQTSLPARPKNLRSYLVAASMPTAPR